ncbi:MAG: family 78 glycoside hydrolase catalytic domain [Clostridia bacterium]|nr:family 78 glycoside hydrolase catalytic domain [Clostridia bacterium]
MDTIYNASWIASPVNRGEAVYALEKAFHLDKPVRSATLQASAIGVYVLQINGARVGDQILSPGWTDYRARVQFQTYDVTDMLSADNCICARVAKGWRMHPRHGWFERQMHKTDTAFIASLHIVYADGTDEVIDTDDTWLCRLTGTRMANMYNGETFDAAFCDTFAVPAMRVLCGYGEGVDEETFRRDHDGEIAYSTDLLIPQQNEPVREQLRLPVKQIFKTPQGDTVIDFGQNLVGYVEFSVCGEAGHKASIRCFEVLDKDGNVYVENLRSADTTITYYCDGTRRTYKPEFTFYGFQYLCLHDWPEEVKAENFTAIVIFSDMKRTGFFECSDPDVNRLFENVVWGQRGNFVDVPTDCPQRDERLGWTGDAQVFVRTASYIYDVRKFFKKWLRDLKVGQSANGKVEHVIPAKEWMDGGACGWADAAVICPWQIYQTYGDREVLVEQYASMRGWIDYMRAHSTDGLWLGGDHFADWLNLDGDDHATSKPYLQNAYFLYSNSLFIRTGKLLGLDMTEYERCFDETLRAFRARFMENGRITENTQTACAEALVFGFLNEEETKSVAAQLAQLVRETGHLTTGFLGTPYLLHALSDNGYVSLAYDLLLRHEFPGWLYSVDNGATTIWEHWDSRNPDGTMWSAGMNSFNHYAYGSVAQWMFECMAGINHDEAHAGFSRITFRPQTDARITFVKASIDTAHGKVAAAWEKTEEGYNYTFTVPEGCTATVILPGKTAEIGAGTYTF